LLGLGKVPEAQCGGCAHLVGSWRYGISE